MSKRIPASIRNRNPGAQYPGPSAKKFGATSHEVLISKDGRHLIATFPSHVQGAAAMFDLLASSKYADGKRTVRQIITKWCGGFYPGTYLAVLKEKAGVTADTVLTRDMLCRADVAVPLAQAMAWQEAGRDYPMGEDEWRQALVMALPAAANAPAEPEPVAEPLPGPPAFEPDNEIPSAKPETRKAEAVKSSGTIRGAAAAFAAGVLKAVEDTWGAVSSMFDGIKQVAGPETTMSLLASSAKTSTTSLLLLLTLAGVAVVIGRRLSAAEEGKIG